MGAVPYARCSRIGTIFVPMHPMSYGPDGPLTLQGGDFEPIPLRAAPDYYAMRRSIERRFELTLARLAE